MARFKRSMLNDYSPSCQDKYEFKRSNFIG